MTKDELQLKIFEGLEIRREQLEKQLIMAHDHDLGYIQDDTAARLDEIEGLIDWIRDL